MRPRVVIIGAGFGGLQCAKQLSGEPVDVLLIDRNNYHLFTPLLYQVASSLLNPSDVAYPVRSVLRGSPNVRFRVADVNRIDHDRKVVRTGDGDEIPYDYLVVASGSQTNFFGLKSVQESALPLKDLPEAIQLRTHVIRAFEGASRAVDPGARGAWLTFAIVGAGPTGVEYAGALSELVNRVLRRDYPELDLSGVRIILIEALAQVLPAFSPRLSADAIRRLRKLKVEVMLNTRVLEATPSTVKLSTGETLGACTLVWCAGVKPSDLAGPRRIAVDEHLRMPGHAGVYAIGDAAGFVQDGKELPMMSPQAMQEGRYVGRHIVAATRGEALKPFRYVDKGTMATIGRHAAVAQVGPLSFTGPIGWIVWLFVHLYYIIGYRNRLAVLASWGWNYLFYDRPIRLITSKTEGGQRGE